jgi:hypothetical protein
MLAIIMQLGSVMDMLMLRQDHLWFKRNMENHPRQQYNHSPHGSSLDK